MSDERDERLYQRAAAVLREPGVRDGDALADALAAVRREAGDATAMKPRRRALMTRGAVRFVAGLAAGIAFAAGLGIGLLAGWRMRGASYAVAAEEMRLRAADVALGVAPGVRPVQFTLVAPAATRVALVGEFNDWDAQATPMSRAAGGAWHVAFPLANGRHVYAFVVDGNSWVSDPQAPRAAERWFGVSNSVLLIDGVRRQ